MEKDGEDIREVFHASGEWGTVHISLHTTILEAYDAVVEAVGELWRSLSALANRR